VTRGQLPQRAGSLYLNSGGAAAAVPHRELGTCDRQAEFGPCHTVLRPFARCHGKSTECWSQIYLSVFSLLFCYSGWLQIVPVIWASYFLFNAHYSNYEWLCSWIG